MPIPPKRVRIEMTPREAMRTLGALEEYQELCRNEGGSIDTVVGKVMTKIGVAMVRAGAAKVER